jgi:6-pyruvoyltetrahydropterin/6-carboxytetrahydropterin synthase
MMAGPLTSPGFVADFGDVKQLAKQWDHRMLLWEKDSLHHLFPTNQDIQREGIVLVPFNPTAENMSKWLAEDIYNSFNPLSLMVELW